MNLSGRTNWLCVYAHFVADPNHRQTRSCPNCGQKNYGIRNIADPESRIGYALFWCESCLYGITVSRAKAPAGTRIWPIDDPASVADVPKFTQVGPRSAVVGAGS